MLTVMPAGDCDLNITRTFHAPRQLVWNCHTKPELLRQWLLGPDAWTMTTCDVDLRVGGTYRYVWEHGDGRTLHLGGEFREIVAPGRLVATERFDEPWSTGEALVTQEFVESGGVTTLTMTIRYPSKQACEAALASGMTSGMETSYARLDRMLASGRV